MGFEKALRAVEVIKDRIQYRSQSLLNLARDYFSYQKSSRQSCNVLLLLETTNDVHRSTNPHVPGVTHSQKTSDKNDLEVSYQNSILVKT